MSLIDEFLTFKEHSQGLAGATIGKYRQYLERLEAWLGEQDMDFLSADDKALEHFCGLHQHKMGVMPRSRRPLVSAVRGFYAWLSRAGHRQDNPAALLEYPRIGRRLPVGMSLSSSERILMQPDLSTFIGVRDAAMLYVLIGCGIRVSGLVSMNESSLLWMDEDGKERLVIKVREKGGHERLVPAPDETALMVRAYLGHEYLDTVDRYLKDGDQVLWISTNNRLVSPDRYHGEARRMAARTVNAMIDGYGERAGVPKNERHPHAMRHLYGTELAESGVDIMQIQALMGHRSPKTSENYIHLATRTLAKSVDKANPLRKMRTHVSSLARHLESHHAKHPSS